MKFKNNKMKKVSYGILVEKYYPGDLESHILIESFDSKNAALNHIKSKYGEMEPFQHSWKNHQGYYWYRPVGQCNGKYYCIYQRAVLGDGG